MLAVAAVLLAVASGGAGTLTVTLSGGRTAQASIIGQDAPADIVVIRAAGISGLTPAAIGFAAALRAGDTVLAVGSPLGLDGTVTSGIVSALNRTISVSSSGPCGGQAASKITGMIQADTAINPDADGDRLLPYGRSAGRAGRAGLIDDASPAPALRARGHMADQQRAVAAGHGLLAGPAAARAPARGGAGPGSAARAPRARARAADRDRVVPVGQHLVQGEDQVQAQVLAARRARRAARTAARTGCRIRALQARRCR